MMQRLIIIQGKMFSKTAMIKKSFKLIKLKTDISRPDPDQDKMSLKEILDKFYLNYNFKERIIHDPIEFPHQYKRPKDIEVSGFISSCFSYGKVELFKPVIRKILALMGKSPYDFLLDFNLNRQRDLFSGVKYRFNKNEDILCLIYVLSESLKKYGSIEAIFNKNYKDTYLNIKEAIIGFIRDLLYIDTSLVYKENIKPIGFLQFLPLPEKGSACKRMNLFLRWMIRDKDIDFGIWKKIPKNKLVIPLDTHIARVSKCLGFTKRSSQDWKMAEDITEALKKFDSEDPLKYDFALCHQGISKICRKMNCSNCNFLSLNPSVF